MLMRSRESKFSYPRLEFFKLKPDINNNSSCESIAPLDNNRHVTAVFNGSQKHVASDISHARRRLPQKKGHKRTIASLASIAFAAF